MITAARAIHYNESTDLRQYDGDPVDDEELQALNDLANDGPDHYRILGPLVGWEPYTHTLRACADEGLPPVFYHVTLAK